MIRFHASQCVVMANMILALGWHGAGTGLALKPCRLFQVGCPFNSTRSCSWITGGLNRHPVSARSYRPGGNPGTFPHQEATRGGKSALRDHHCLKLSTPSRPACLLRAPFVRPWTMNAPCSRERPACDSSPVRIHRPSTGCGCSTQACHSPVLHVYRRSGRPAC